MGSGEQGSDGMSCEGLWGLSPTTKWRQRTGRRRTQVSESFCKLETKPDNKPVGDSVIYSTIKQNNEWGGESVGECDVSDFHADVCHVQQSVVFGQLQ